MLKIIGFIFILFSGISLIVIALLFTGFEINNLSYKNINIEKVYLKYDKKLNISSDKITISNPTTQEKTQIKSSFTFDYKNDLFIFNIKNFELNGTELKVKGLVYIDTELIDLDKKSQIMVEDLNLIFDNKMETVTAKRVFVNHENDIINLSLTKPFYGDVNMEDSTITYLIDRNILKLYLKTKSLLNNTLKNALLRYDVELNTIQYDGKNDISANIFIPFDKGDIFIEADAIILDSNIENYGHKYKVDKSVIHYQDQIVSGTVDLNNYNYDDINVTNSQLNYTINLKDKLKIKVNSKKLFLQKDKQQFNLYNSLFEMKDNNITLSSNLKSLNNKLNISINNQTDLTKKELNGTLNIQYTDKNISLQSDTITYSGNFIKDDKIELDIQSKKIHLSKPENLNINNLSVQIKDNIINSKLKIDSETKDYNFRIINKTNLNTKKSSGSININKLVYENLVDVKNKNLPYNISFIDDINVNIPTFGLTYFKDHSTLKHKLLINNPNKILESLTFIKADKNHNGFINIESNDFKDTTVKIKDISFDIDSSYLINKESSNKEERLILPLFPMIQLSYENSNIKYDDFLFSFDKFNLYTNDNILNLNIKKDNSVINLQTKDNSISFSAKNLTDKYINSFLNKEILEDGYVDINAYADDINYLSGDVQFHKTTVKNVTIVNSLITFVNTTPAIINPLLALPTVFRMAETGFDTNGYYMKHGDGSFRYNIPTQQLDVYDLHTNGKMSNFIVNSHQDFRTKKVDANVNISFLKDFTKAINHIPVLGYIIMGDDGEFRTSVDIKGTIDKPILETHTVKEATRGVTGVLKRILTLPLQPFKGKTTNTKEEQIEHQKKVNEILNSED